MIFKKDRQSTYQVLEEIDSLLLDGYFSKKELFNTRQFTNEQNSIASFEGIDSIIFANGLRVRKINNSLYVYPITDTFGSYANDFYIHKGSHLITSGPSPVITPNASYVKSVSYAVPSNDITGSLNFVTSAALNASTAYLLATVTFAKAYANTPVTKAWENGPHFIYTYNVSPTSFQIYIDPSSSIASGTSFYIRYEVVGTAPMGQSIPV